MNQNPLATPEAWQAFRIKFLAQPSVRYVKLSRGGSEAQKVVGNSVHAVDDPRTVRAYP